MNIVAMLAKNKMIETEFDIEGKDFDEIDKEKTGQFEPPFDDYGWKRTIKELKFPNVGIRRRRAGRSERADHRNDLQDFHQFLSKSIREVTVAIIWKRTGTNRILPYQPTGWT